VELDDLPNVQELFAVDPDDFLRFQHRNKRHRSQPIKATHPKLTFQFHDFESSSPTLQVGQRYFTGQWEEPMGTALFFRKRGDVPNINENQSSSTSSAANNHNAPTAGPSNSSSSTSTRPCDSLNSIVPEPEIPYDPVFVKLGTAYKNSYEMVAKADKVLKLQAHVASTKSLPRTLKQGHATRHMDTGIKIPRGYTARAILAGHYQPQRTYGLKKQRKNKVNWKEVEGELTVLSDRKKIKDDLLVVQEGDDDDDVQPVEQNESPSKE
jgi:hypothetical protein